MVGPSTDTRQPTADTLDAAALETLRGMLADAEPGMMAALLDALFEDAPRLVEQMRSGISEGNAELTQRAAHTLKSDAAQFGALRLADHCRELEYLARSGSLGGAGALLTAVEEAWSEASSALLALRPQPEESA